MRLRGLAALALLSLLLLAPAAQAGWAPGFGTLGSATVGSGAGQTGGIPRGVTVNPTGAGGVSAGDVYVSDFSNNRITQYTATGTFIRAFGMDVVASGPDNASEVQRITVKATAGTFRLTFGATGTKTTGATGSGDLTASSTTVENVVTTTGSFIQGEAIAGTGIPAGTTIVGVGAGTLTLSQAATATGAATALTADLPFGASASLLQSAVNALTTVSTGGGSVAVSGGPGDGTGSSPYVVTFNGGPLKGTDVAQMTGANGFLVLSGGSGTGANEAKVTTSNPGNTGFEICNVVVNPTDVCKAGTSSSAAAGVAGGQGLAIDPVTGNVFQAADTSKRINVYSATGQFQGAFGWKVNAASPEEKLQFCTFATGCAAGSAGAGAGQLGVLGPTGAPQNQPAVPAVSPLNGNLYVPVPGNRRIDVFSLTLNGAKEVTGVAFVKGFGGDVVPTLNDKQTVTLSGATGGSFDLAFESQSTAATGTGTLEAGSNEITAFSPLSRKFVVGEEISGPGIPAGAIATAVTFDSVTLTLAATATHEGASLAATLPFNATTAAVQGALGAVPAIGNGNVTVTGAAGGPWTVELNGKFAGVNQPQMTGDASHLTGASPSIAVLTTQDGANGANTGLESCTVATTCKAGATGSGADGSFAQNTPNNIAIDSTGAVYATGQPQGLTCGCSVQKFNATGTAVEEFAPAQLTTLNGNGAPATVSPRAVTINAANDRVIVLKRNTDTTFKLYEFTKTGTLIDESPPAAGFPINNFPPNPNFGPQGFAAFGERLYVVLQGTTTSPQKIFGRPPAPKATIETASGIGQTSATFSGIAQPSAPGGEGGFTTVAYFEYSDDGINWKATEPIEIGDGTGAGNPNSCPTGNPPTCNVSQLVGGLSPNTSYSVRMVVSNGTAATSSAVSFTTVSSAPSAYEERSLDVDQDSATLSAMVNPNGRQTSYRFEWGTGTSYGKRVPAEFDVQAGSGTDPVHATAHIEGLSPATAYHFRLVATSTAGTTSGEDRELMTLNAAGLPNNRGAELVSPPDKRPAGSVEITNPFSGNQVFFQVADNGESVSYPILNGMADSTAGGEAIYLGRRSAGGWGVQQLTPPALDASPEAGAIGQPSGLVRYFSPADQSCHIVDTYQALTADTPPADIANEVSNLYRVNNITGEVDLITTQVPLNPTAASPEGLYYEILGVTADCSKVFFRLETYLYNASDSQLYEWDEGVLRDAGLLPDGSVPTQAFSTFTGPSSVPKDSGQYQNVVSPEGNVFFMAKSNSGLDSGKTAVFVRKGPGEVVDASQTKTATAPLGARYQAASPDGSSVFFLANYGLTATSSSGPADNCTPTEPNTSKPLACAIYRYDVDTGQLVDVSADANPADPIGAAAMGVMAVSGDGSTVYFGARGQLVPGKGRTYKQNLQGSGFANVYRWHAGQLSYVGSLASADLKTWSSPAFMDSKQEWTAWTSEDGDYFLFPGHDNITGTNPRLTNQAYLYSASSGATECISCPAGGAEVDPESRILLLGGTGAYPQRVKPTPRSLTDEGRVFFSDARLIVGPTGKQEVDNTLYEWHDGQLSVLASGRNLLLVDAGGPDGRDLFLTTYQHLSPWDYDTAKDIYDLRSGGGFAPPPVPPPGCDPAADACQGTPTSQPGTTSPSSSEFNGPGDPPVQKPGAKKCGKGKVLKHGKCVKKPKHKKTTKANKRSANKSNGGAK